jgi:hypothetical protein
MTNVVDSPPTPNDRVLLLVGKSATGKSASLMYLDNPEGVAYLNCEAGKKLPFKSKFKELTITDPLDVLQAFTEVESNPDIHTIVVDSLTYLMDMYESIYVLPSANTMQAWGQFAQFFKNLMQQQVAKSTKNVIFIAHTADQLNEGEMITETKVPVKGSLKNNGIESYFTIVVAAKKVALRQLEGYKNSMLTITPRDEMLGYKHVFQTQPTKQTINDRLRGPIGLFEIPETYVDNNMQLMMDKLRDYYE